MSKLYLDRVLDRVSRCPSQEERRVCNGFIISVNLLRTPYDVSPLCVRCRQLSRVVFVHPSLLYRPHPHLAADNRGGGTESVVTAVRASCFRCTRPDDP